MSDNKKHIILKVFENFKEYLEYKIYGSDRSGTKDLFENSVNTELNEHDENQIKIGYLITDEDAHAYISQQTGLERVKEMFFPENNIKMSPQMELTCYTLIQTGFTFAIITSIFGGNLARERFLLKTKHKSFTTKFIANRGCNDATLIGALKYGIKFGFKAAIFSGLFMITSQMISVYRNKTGMLENIIAGGVTCGTLRINGGPKAFVGAGTIGMFLGLVGGIVINGIFKIFDFSQEQVNLECVKERFAFERPPIKHLSSNLREELFSTTNN